MKITKSVFELTFTSRLLGTASNNPDLHAEFIAAKAPTTEASKEEIASISVPLQIERAKTVFSRDAKGIHLWDYQIRGFFKETILALIELGDCGISKYSYKKAVDSFLFIKPRVIYVLDQQGEIITKPDQELTRPMRVETMQGERVCLSTSEVVNEGRKIQFEVTTLEFAANNEALGTNGKSPKKPLAVIDKGLLMACLDYGQFKGIGQWRGGGNGSFSYTEVK